MQWRDWMAWLLMAAFVIVMSWYGVSLPLPHR
jgi:hypothetical protein